MRVYGRSEGIVFIEPQANVIPEECVQNASERKGLSGMFARFYVKYNIDRFASRPILHQWLENGKV